MSKPATVGAEAVARVDDVAPGTTLAVAYCGRRLRLCNVAGAIHAIEDRCPHAGIAFDGGKLRGAILECPMHGARFDVRSGEVLSPPARRNLVTVRVRMDGDGGISIDETATKTGDPGQ